MRELKKLLKEHPYKIVHIHRNSASMAMDAFVAWHCDVPVIIGHSHNTSCNIKWQHYLLKPFVNHYLDYRFACSEEAGKWIFGNKKDVRVIHNALELDKFKFNLSMRDKYRNDMGLKDKFVVGYVGRLFDKQKNVSRLISIFKDLLKTHPDSCLLLVGDGSDRAMFEQQREDIRDKVIFLGQRNDVANLLMAMDAFVMTSWYEGLANTLIEAQAAGLKTVVSSTIPTEDILGIQKIVSLDEPNEAWVQAILEDAPFDRSKTEEPIAKAGYDIKIEASKLEEFYMEVAR